MKKMIKITYLLLAICLMASVVTAQKRKSSSSKKATVSTKKKATTTKKKATQTKSSQAKSTNATTTKTTSTATKPITQTSVSSDTSKPDVVVLYASFKPTLRTAAKINFSAATPYSDTTRMALNYVVPAQNLFFSYQPVPIKPLALVVDSGYIWTNDGYVKAGYGSFSQPYIEAGFSFGNGKTSQTSIYAMHNSAKGNLADQQFSKSALAINGNYQTKSNHEWLGKLFFTNSSQNQYGYLPNTLVLPKDSLKQQFNTIGLQAMFKRKEPNAYGLTYLPSINFNYFFDARDANEFNVITKVPVTKAFSKEFSLLVDLTADFTAFNSNKASIANNLFYLNTALIYKGKNLKVHAGLQPTWDNSETKLLPNVTAEVKINGEKFIVEAGSLGYFQKNSYQSLAATNPWLQQPTNLFNTNISEQFVGFKGSAGTHLTYNARVAFMSMQNMPLFVNDVQDGRSFLIVGDSNIQAIKIHGELGYNIQEKFSFLAGINIYQFTKSDYDKPFGLIPFEITGSLKWKLLKDLHIKSDVFIWDGAKYRTKTLQTEKLSAAIDLTAAVEYTIMPKLNLWLQFNNLLNSKYQRWNQYEVLGLNVLGGVVYSFR
ncbi:MAG: hypothetical protein V9E96_03045 [Chitinophagaceae bacterium]|nr:hypothetical protein [Chitinophagaceae bacterium]MBP9740457.1 hypothetical protein [Chitinophagaceae bacterium]